MSGARTLPQDPVGSPSGVYDPPRARRSGIFSRGYYAVRRRFPKVDPFLFSVGRAPDLVAFLVPGAGPYFLGMRLAATVISSLSAVALLLAVAAIGATWAVLPVWVLISAHGFGTSLYVTHRWPDLSLVRRMLLSMVLATAFFGLLPRAIELVLSPVVVLAGDREEVYLIDPRRGTEPPQSGEILLVAHEGFGNRYGLRMHRGNYLVEVVAVGSGIVWVEGGLTTWSNPPRITPVGEGEDIRLNESELLVWPVNMRRLAFRSVRVEARSFVLDRSRIVGRPYKRWFWRTFAHESIQQS